MKLNLPISILQLTLIGFTIVVVPLIIALVNAIIKVDSLSQRMTETVFSTAQAVDASRVLLSDVISLERSARQYLVLQDPEILAGYEIQRIHLSTLIDELLALFDDEEIREPLYMLRRSEGEMHASLLFPQADETGGTDRIDNLPALAELVRPLPFAIGQQINRNSNRVSREASRLRRRLFVQALSLIPLALVMAVIFGWLITRPLRQVASAIRHLGGGDLSRPIEVSGPRDVRELSNRLEWMRYRLNELEEQKTLFLRHVSHELKTPLTAIREGVELLSDEVVGPLSADQIEVTAILRDASQQLQKQIENLLAFNLAMAEDIIAAPVPVELDRLIKDVLEKQALAIRGRGVRIIEHLKAITVMGDPDKLGTVFDNLLSNAIKHSPEGGTIGLRLREKHQEAIFDIIDEGSGIDEADRERIFDAFYQGRREASGHVKGTGLGLAISERLVRLHGGSITLIDSTKGAHFRVTFPVNG